MIIRLIYTDGSFSYIYSPDKLTIKKKDLVRIFNKWWNDNLDDLGAGYFFDDKTGERIYHTKEESLPYWINKYCLVNEYGEKAYLKEFATSELKEYDLTIRELD